jgi:hypothetical protein
MQDESSIKWQPLEPSPDDWEEWQRYIALEIMRVFQIPPPVVGILDKRIDDVKEADQRNA